MTHWDIDPQDVDADTGMPYGNYSSPSLDTSFADGEAVDDDDRCECCDKPLLTVGELRAGVHTGVCALLMDGDPT